MDWLVSATVRVLSTHIPACWLQGLRVPHSYFYIANQLSFGMYLLSVCMSECIFSRVQSGDAGVLGGASATLLQQRCCGVQLPMSVAVCTDAGLPDNAVQWCQQNKTVACLMALPLSCCFTDVVLQGLWLSSYEL